MMPDTFNLLKQGDMTIEEALYPEIHISKIDPTTIKTGVIASGFPTMDDFLLLKDNRSELIIIGSRPSHGKSAFLFQLAYNVAHEYPVHVFSLEMDKESIIGRLIAGHINRSMLAIQTGAIPDNILMDAHKQLSSLKYYIDDRAGLHIDHLCEAAIKCHLRVGTKLIVVDYLQLVRGRDRGTREQEVADITASLKSLARELKVPIIVGAQLNRQCEYRGSTSGDYKPIISDLRESGSIEQDADMVLLLHRESRYTGQREGEADIIVAKNRNGPVGSITMQFSSQQTKFIDKKENV